MTSKYDRYSKEELVKIIEDRDRKPTFGLVWERNDIDFDRSFNQDFVALDAIGELSCGVGPWSNLLIEGDNFDALRYLRMTHAGRVKCICIDPSYNTGNRDFIWRTRQGTNGDQGCLLSVDHEHMLVYSNVGFTFNGYGKSYEMYGNPNQNPKGIGDPTIQNTTSCRVSTFDNITN